MGVGVACVLSAFALMALPSSGAPASHATALVSGTDRVYVTGRPIPTEGARVVLRVTPVGGRKALRREIQYGSSVPPVGHARLRVPPGEYFVARVERVCDANCGNLSPPQLDCERRVDLRTRSVVSVVFRASSRGPCIAR